MLDLRDIAASFSEIADETVRRAERVAQQMETARALSSLGPDDWAAHRLRVDTCNVPWLAAKFADAAPLSQGEFAPEPCPARYTAIASDGSQAPLDRHEVAPCYVLNTSQVLLHYGSGERAVLGSRADVRYRDEDIYLESGLSGCSYVGDREIAARRFLAEIEVLGELIETCKGRTAVAFVDGSLIRWQDDPRPGEKRSEAIEKLMPVLSAAAEARIPVVGYLSRPASREVMGALRVALCRESEAFGPRCACRTDADAPCRALDNLRDADLFAHLLRPGERSGIFESRSQVLRFYSPPENAIGMFYYHAGDEIARVEAPLWALRDSDLLARCHSVVHDQTAKGRGYPICLSEAHELAVVRAADRDAFYHLLQRALIRSSAPAARTAKSASKRRPVL